MFLLLQPRNTRRRSRGEGKTGESKELRLGEVVGGHRQDSVWKQCPSSCLCHFSPGLAVVFVAARSACQQSAVTGGYFNKLLQFLERSCIALASLFTANGACVAGCGPREALSSLEAGEEGAVRCWGGGVCLRVWECSCEQQPDPGEGVAAPVPPVPCPGSAAGIHTFQALFLLRFLFIARQTCVYDQGGKLPLAPVRPINKKRNRTRKRVCGPERKRLKPKHREKAQLLSPRPSGAPSARPPASPPARSQAFIYLFFWLKKKFCIFLNPSPPHPLQICWVAAAKWTRVGAWNEKFITAGLCLFIRRELVDWANCFWSPTAGGSPHPLGSLGSLLPLDAAIGCSRMSHCQIGGSFSLTLPPSPPPFLLALAQANG